MINLRKYGEKPYNVVAVHGGPGAPGSVGSLANEIASGYSVIEPFQSKDSIEEQVNELREVILRHCNTPVVLVGHSWGAWLSYIYASKYPNEVAKLILVGCGAFETKYLSGMNQSRQDKLSIEEHETVNELAELLYDPNCMETKKVFKELGRVMTKADTYEAISDVVETLDYQPDVFKKVMAEVSDMRKSGNLIKIAKHITCPVIAIHGDEDSHPYQGVEEPLSEVLEHFSLIRLEKCGHYPWNEVHARDEFYEVLFAELHKTLEE